MVEKVLQRANGDLKSPLARIFTTPFVKIRQFQTISNFIVHYCRGLEDFYCIAWLTCLCFTIKFTLCSFVLKVIGGPGGNYGGGIMKVNMMKSTVVPKTCAYDSTNLSPQPIVDMMAPDAMPDSKKKLVEVSLWFFTHYTAVFSLGYYVLSTVGGGAIRQFSGLPFGEIVFFQGVLSTLVC